MYFERYTSPARHKGASGENPPLQRRGAAEVGAPPEGDFIGQPVTDAALASLRWYKRTISPLLPPSPPSALSY